MGDWIAYRDDLCGTAACLGGWAELELIENGQVNPDKNSNEEIRDATHVFYGLHSWVEDQELFMMTGAGCGIVTFDHIYTPEERSAIGIRVLEILREEQVIDWDRAIREVDTAGKYAAWVHAQNVLYGGD